jgi:hypothetical protein
MCHCALSTKDGTRGQRRSNLRHQQGFAPTSSRGDKGKLHKSSRTVLQTTPTKPLISEEEVLSKFNEQHRLLSKVPAKEVERIKQEHGGDLSKLTTEQIT